MVPIHERTRRVVCRWLFVVLCALPTAVVLSWCVVRLWPGTLAAERAWLRSITGMQVSLARVTHPRPGATLLHDLELHDPETLECVVRCRYLEAVSGDKKVIAKASHVELFGAQAEQVWRLIERHLRGNSPAPETQLYLSAAELTWHVPRGASQTFVDLTARVGPTTRGGHEADFRFRLAGAEDAELSSIVVERFMRQEQLCTHVELRTGGNRWPFQVLAPLFDAPGWFGAQARFDGALSLEEQNGQWSGRIIGGRLERVDLDSLVRQRFPHGLSGLADITIRDAVVSHGRLVKIDGTFDCRGGAIARSLVESGRQHMKFQGAAVMPASATNLPFEQLAFTFVLDSRGLQMLGGCEGPPGALLMGDDAPLWQQGPEPLQSVAAFIRTLVPASEVLVPATDASDWLIHALPVPPIVAARPRDGTAPPPRVHIKPVP